MQLRSAGRTTGNGSPIGQQAAQKRKFSWLYDLSEAAVAGWVTSFHAASTAIYA